MVVGEGEGVLKLLFGEGKEKIALKTGSNKKFSPSPRRIYSR